MTPAYEGDPEQAKIIPNDRWYAEPAPSTRARGCQTAEKTSSGRVKRDWAGSGKRLISFISSVLTIQSESDVLHESA